MSAREEIRFVVTESHFWDETVQIVVHGQAPVVGEVVEITICQFVDADFPVLHRDNEVFLVIAVTVVYVMSQESIVLLEGLRVVRPLQV